jgi:hypothetical protein
MNFARMKPLPKALLIALVVGTVVYGGTKLMPEKAAVPTVPPIAVTSVPAEGTPAAEAAKVAATPAPVQAPAEAPAVLTPAGGQDAGLANVLKAGSK